MTQSRPLRLFISYAHKDDPFRQELEVHLSSLKRQKILEIWSDRAIEPGQEWEQSIKERLETSDIILLLVSPNFLASEFIYDKELKCAMERHEAGKARVIPVFLRPCEWKGASFGKLQGVPDNAKPISQWRNRDEAFRITAEAIREATKVFVEKRETLLRFPLHFIFIVSCSNSMHGDKVQSLNYAIRSLIPAMQKVADENRGVQVLVRVLKSSRGAQWHLAQPTPVNDLQWVDLQAYSSGYRDIGEALFLVSEVLRVPPMPECTFPPVLILITDGGPTDDFPAGLNALLDQFWGREAVRIGVPIGSDADEDTLQEFIGHSEHKLIRANNMEDLVRLIKWETCSINLGRNASNTSGAGDIHEPTSSSSDIW